MAAAGYGTVIKIVNSAMTIVAIMLVERKGRVFLLKLGTGGIVVSLCVLAALFYQTEAQRIDVKAQVASMVKDGKLDFDVAGAPFAHGAPAPLQVSILYNYGNKQRVAEAFMPTAASDAVLVQAAALDPALPSSRLPLENASRIRTLQSIRIAPDATEQAAPLTIARASAGPIPSRMHGLLTALCIGGFIAFFSIGPGVCVWLALSELMPTRIRSVGMGVALLINQGVGTVIAAAFLPIVGNYGFYAMFLFWAACTVVYFITATFFLPETKGRTLEEIETHFAGKANAGGGKQ